MFKKSLWKDSFRTITKTWPRFLSLFAIIALGAGFFVGIRAAEPNMIFNATSYYEKYNLQDIQVMSTYGLREKDLRIMRTVKDVDFLPYRSVDRQDKYNSNIYRVLPNFNDFTEVNNFNLIEGTFPQNDNEVAVDYSLFLENENDYAIGKTIHFNFVGVPEEKDAKTMEGNPGVRIGEKTKVEEDEEPEVDKKPELIRNSFVISGYVRSPMFVDEMTKGSTNIGKGILDGFLVVSPNAFKGEYYTRFAVNVDDAIGINSYSQEYQDVIDKKIEEIENAFFDRSDEVFEESKDEAREKIEDAEKEIKDARKKVRDGRKEIYQAKKDIESARSKLNDSEQKLVEAKDALDKAQGELDREKARYMADLKEGETLESVGLGYVQERLDYAQKTLDHQRTRYEENKQLLEEERQKAEIEIADGEKKIADNEQKLLDAEQDIVYAEKKVKDAKDDLKKLPKPKYIVSDRSFLSGNQEYKDNANRIGAVATVFPMIFFLISALVCYTVMTRMVEEERINIGTYKALGYTRQNISNKFFLYASLAMVLGIIVGVVVGNWLLPQIVISAYGMMFSIPDLGIKYYWYDILTTTLLTSLTTIGPAITTTRNSLKEEPANLLRAKAPKSGSSILLEKWAWFWKRLSFNMKVTLRNLFRFKGRNTMTTVGVAGCTMLLLTGFAISDSVSGLADKQFGDIVLNDLTIQYTESADDDDIKEVNNKLFDGNEKLSGYLNIRAENFDTVADDVYQQLVRAIILDENANYLDFYNFYDSTNMQEIKVLPENGVLLTRKLAKLLNKKAGDELSLADEHGSLIKFEISAVIENYIGHNIYLTDKLYEKLMGDKAQANASIISFDNQDQESQEKFASLVNEEWMVSGTAFTQSIRETLNETLKTLTLVTLILVLAAGILDFIVLYSLINVNVSERERELSTIKVLGSKTIGVTMYVYREVIILVLIGIAVGLLSGPGLTGMILKMVEVDNMIFPLRVEPASFGISAALAILFSMIVMLLMHYKLRRIDMVEAMKGVE